MLDMNCDKSLCEADLFTFIESHKEDNDFFGKCLIYDLQDIAAVLSENNHELTINDDVMDNRRPMSPKIASLDKFIAQMQIKKQKRKEIQDN